MGWHHPYPVRRRRRIQPAVQIERKHALRSTFMNTTSWGTRAARVSHLIRSFCRSLSLKASTFFGASHPSDSTPPRGTPPETNNPRTFEGEAVPFRPVPRQDFPSTGSGLVSGRGASGRQEHSPVSISLSMSAVHLQYLLRRGIKDGRSCYCE